VLMGETSGTADKPGMDEPQQHNPEHGVVSHFQPVCT
jgi:hypothetical protein